MATVLMSLAAVAVAASAVAVPNMSKSIESKWRKQENGHFNSGSTFREQENGHVNSGRKYEPSGLLKNGQKYEPSRLQHLNQKYAQQKKLTGPRESQQVARPFLNGAHRSHNVSSKNLSVSPDGSWQRKFG